VNAILSRQKEEIQKKNEAIMSSLQYAQRIQSAIHPAEKKVEETLGEFFVLYKPKDIVSGDFYWVGQTGDVVIVAAVDCTGHGVPGAFMSMIGGSLLRQIIMEKGITNPAEILMRMDSGVRKFLRQEETQNRDGMDMGLCVIDKPNKLLHFSGAKNPCLYVKNGKIEEVKGSKQAVGGAVSKKLNDPFKTTTINLEVGTYVYLLSDGFQDQFGGAENKKFGFSNLKRLLASLSGLPSHEQKEELEKTFEAWRGDYKQIDDILIFGFRL
jgi:serine phosphatase RsbU (regulator of sigma subunit)